MVVYVCKCIIINILKLQIHKENTKKKYYYFISNLEVDLFIINMIFFNMNKVKL